MAPPTIPRLFIVTEQRETINQLDERTGLVNPLRCWNHPFLSLFSLGSAFSSSSSVFFPRWISQPIADRDCSISSSPLIGFYKSFSSLSRTCIRESIHKLSRMSSLPLRLDLRMHREFIERKSLGVLSSFFSFFSFSFFLNRHSIFASLFYRMVDRRISESFDKLPVPRIKLPVS